MNTPISPKAMERAFLAGDGDYDGLFVVAVRTTSIFCKPSCPAKKPLLKNVEYFATVQDATAAGYRPCARCKPMEAPGQPPAWLSALLKEIEAAPDRRWTGKDLRERGLTPERVRRWFQRHYGMSFAAWCRTRRLGQAYARLREGARIDEVVFDHGYDSHSGFREAFSQTFRLPPGQAVSSGACLHSMVFQTPLGPMLAACTDQAICFLEFADRSTIQQQIRLLSRRFDLPLVPGETPLLQHLKSELEAYFEGRLRIFTAPLQTPGTPFQERVWAELKRISYGETISYDVLAARAGSPGAQRAAGHANGMNPIAIVIPCHRVVGKNGKLSGYGGGVWRKRFLLDLERAGSLGSN